MYISKFWTVFVHDKHEQVLLQSHAIESLPAITVVSDEDEAVHKKKAKIIPRLQILPEPSDKLPCNDSNHYSTNRFELK